VLDIFRSDAFSLVELTAAINRLPVVPGFLGEYNLFTERPVTMPFAAIEEQGGKLMLVPSQTRGVHNRVISRNQRNLRSFVVPHFPLDAAVMADDVQGVRAFGTEDQEEMVSDILNEKMATMRQSLELTHEYLRTQAVQGIVKDADGSTTLVNYFTEFGISETVISFDFSAGEDLLAKSEEVVETMEEKLGGVPYSAILALCGKNFYRNLKTHESVRDARAELDPSINVNLERGGFEFGDISWRPYRGKVGSVDFFDPDGVRFVPLGVPELFLDIIAPAPFMDTAGRPGQLIYAKQAPIGDWDEGIQLHSQMNVLPLCTRPSVLLKGTDDTP
jgi:hypothetical protein